MSSDMRSVPDPKMYQMVSKDKMDQLC